MADLIELHQGMVPWEAGGELERVYHQYDMPLIGIVSQFGVDYLFQCLTGQLDPFNLWAYTIVSRHEQKELASASGPEFDDLIGSILHSRAGVLAVAIDDGEDTPRVAASTEFEDTDGGIVASLEVLQEKLSQTLERVRGGRETVERTLLTT